MSEEEKIGAEPAKILLPVVAILRGVEPFYTPEDVLGYMYVPASAIERGKNYFYYRVLGDAMTPEIKPGTYALVRQQGHLEEDAIGIIMSRNDETDEMVTKIRRVRYLKGGRVLLVPSNPEYDIETYNQEEIKIIGKVIRVVHPLDMQQSPDQRGTILIDISKKGKELTEKEREEINRLVRDMIDFIERL